VRLILIVEPATSGPTGQVPDDVWLWSNQWNESSRGKPKYSEKTCPPSDSSTTNLIWIYLGWKQGRRGEKPATNSLSCGTAVVTYIKTRFKIKIIIIIFNLQLKNFDAATRHKLSLTEVYCDFPEHTISAVLHKQMVSIKYCSLIKIVRTVLFHGAYLNSHSFWSSCSLRTCLWWPVLTVKVKFSLGLTN
jgi:hypothetical protein